MSSSRDPDQNGHSPHLGPDHPAGSAVPPAAAASAAPGARQDPATSGTASMPFGMTSPGTMPTDSPDPSNATDSTGDVDDGLIIDLTNDVARVTTDDELAAESSAAEEQPAGSPAAEATAAPDNPAGATTPTSAATAPDAATSTSSTGESLRVQDLFKPLLGAAAISFGAGVVFMAILSIGDLPFIAHPGILLIATAAITAIVGLMFRSEKVEPASVLATVAIGIFIVLGVILMLLALSIQLREGDTDDARQSLALLVIAPVTMLIGFILIPAVKAARAMTGDRAKGALPKQAGRALSIVSLIMGFFGLAGMLLGLLDWTRGLAPTDAPYTLFAGAFAALGGMLLNGLSRTITSAPPVELSNPGHQAR